MKKRLTKDEIQEVIRIYTTENISKKDLGQRFGYTGDGIRVLLKRYGIQTRSDLRTYTLDQSFFDIIDQEDKAYFLGLMYADGYNYEKRDRIKIQLQERDAILLDLFRKSLKTDLPLRFYEKETERHQNKLSLEVCSKQLSESLSRLGCFQNKSLTLKFPTKQQVPDHLLSHFIRGYMDGDGCICPRIRNEKYFCCEFTFLSSEQFARKLQDILNTKFGANFHFSFHRNGISGRIGSSNPKDIARCLDWIYKDATVFLPRKHAKYLFLKERLGLLDDATTTSSTDCVSKLV